MAHRVRDRRTDPDRGEQVPRALGAVGLLAVREAAGEGEDPLAGRGVVVGAGEGGLGLDVDRADAGGVGRDVGGEADPLAGAERAVAGGGQQVEVGAPADGGERRAVVAAGAGVDVEAGLAQVVEELVGALAQRHARGRGDRHVVEAAVLGPLERDLPGARGQGRDHEALAEAVAVLAGQEVGQHAERGVADRVDVVGVAVEAPALGGAELGGEGAAVERQLPVDPVGLTVVAPVPAVADGEDGGELAGHADVVAAAGRAGLGAGAGVDGGLGLGGAQGQGDGEPGEGGGLEERTMAGGLHEPTLRPAPVSPPSPPCEHPVSPRVKFA